MTTKPDDDRAWDDLLERWELAGTDDPQALAEVEAALAAVEAAPPLTAERIAAAVEYVETEGAPPANVYALPRRLRWVKVAAAVLLATMLTAAVSVGVYWANRSDSRTLSYPKAIQVLCSPPDDELLQLAALRKTTDCATAAINALRRSMQGDLAILAQVRADDIDRVLATGGGLPVVVTDSVDEDAEKAELGSLPVELRAYHLDRLTGAAITCIGAMRDFSSEFQRVNTAARQRLANLRKLAEQLR